MLSLFYHKYVVAVKYEFLRIAAKYFFKLEKYYIDFFLIFFLFQLQLNFRAYASSVTLNKIRNID